MDRHSLCLQNDSEGSESDVRMASRILVVGDAFMDIVTVMEKLDINPGGDTLASSISLLPGGSGLNTSVRMKEIGKELLDVTFFSAIGDDEQGKLLSKAVVDGGVDPFFVVMSEDSTGSCIVMSTKDERSFITNRGVINRITCKDFESPNGEPLNGNINKNLDHVHVAGYYNCPKLGVGVEDVLGKFLAYNYTTSLNPQSDAEGKYDMIDSMCKYLSYLFCNEQELRAMAGGCFKVEDGGSIRGCALHFIKAGCAHIVVTNGAKGASCFYCDPTTYDKLSGLTAPQLSEVTAVPPAVEVVDTTGAGDAFIAGFLASIVPQKSVKHLTEDKALASLPYEKSLSKSKREDVSHEAPLDGAEDHQQRVIEALELGCLAGAHCCTLLGASTLDRTKLQGMRAARKQSGVT